MAQMKACHCHEDFGKRLTERSTLAEEFLKNRFGSTALEAHVVSLRGGAATCTTSRAKEKKIKQIFIFQALEKKVCLLRAQATATWCRCALEFYVPVRISRKRKSGFRYM